MFFKNSIINSAILKYAVLTRTVLFSTDVTDTYYLSSNHDGDVTSVESLFSFSFELISGEDQFENSTFNESLVFICQCTALYDANATLSEKCLQFQNASADYECSLTNDLYDQVASHFFS